MVAGCSTGSLNPSADKDHDGGVSFTEFDAYMKDAIFASFDANKDGVVTMAEWRAMNPSGPKSNFIKADRNGNGRVSKAESDAKMDKDGSMMQLFKKIDKDQSGKLSEAEIAAFKSLMERQPQGTDLEKLKQAADKS